MSGPANRPKHPDEIIYNDAACPERIFHTERVIVKMIKSRKDLEYYTECDRITMGKELRAIPWNDTYYFLHDNRHYEYWYNNRRTLPGKLISVIWRIRYKRISMKCGFSIPVNTIGPGLCIPHYGTIVISENARIGENCKIHVGVNIGAINRSEKAKTIGNNVYIRPGAKQIGGGFIKDNSVIGGNAAVTGNVEESITVGGIPARKIAKNDSSVCLIKATDILKRREVSGETSCQ